MVWYNDFREPLIGRLDPRTGETKEWTMPPLKPGFPEGTLSIEFNREGYFVDSAIPPGRLHTI